MEKQINKIPLVHFPEFKEDWEVKKLGAVAKITTGRTPSTSKKNIIMERNNLFHQQIYKEIDIF